MKVTHLDGVLATGIQCRPPKQTKKVLNLGNQQRSDLGHKGMRATLWTHFSFGIVKFDTFPTNSC